jgi:hypothetical protein
LKCFCVIGIITQCLRNLWCDLTPYELHHYATVLASSRSQLHIMHGHGIRRTYAMNPPHHLQVLAFRISMDLHTLFKTAYCRQAPSGVDISVATTAIVCLTAERHTPPHSRYINYQQ